MTSYCANISLKNVIFDMHNLLRGIFTVHVESEFQILKNLLFFFWHWWMKESLLDFIKDYCTWNALNFSFYTQIVSHKVDFDTGSSPEVGEFYVQGPVTKTDTDNNVHAECPIPENDQTAGNRRRGIRRYWRLIKICGLRRLTDSGNGRVQKI